jgi:alcohol dehydrogenase (cytochrome c)
MARNELAMALCLGLAACAQPWNRSAAPPPDQAATGHAAVAPATDAEFQLAPLPTHWLAKQPVGTGAGPVTQAMLRDPFADRGRWLHYGGNYLGWRHSPLTSLSPANAKELRLAWAFPTGVVGQFEVSPVVYDGVMYVTASYNRLFALDARSGRLLWRYDHKQPPDLRACCGPVNRGVAITGDKLLMATLDAHLLAFDRRTGAILWDSVIEPYAEGFAPTAAPLVVENLAIIGTGGGEYGIRGFFDAYDVETGKRVWRHFTVPAPGEPGAESWAGESGGVGGAPTWTTGAYDAETDTIFWTTGNPSPDFNGDLRDGDNLFSNSLLAVDRKTGQRRWHFQFTPHDVWDFDGNTHLFLVEVMRDGKKIPAIAQANRNGFFYLIDRRDGTFLRGTPYVDVNWAKLDAMGRPIPDPAAYPTEQGSSRVCPSNMGGMNGAWTGAYDPKLGLAFIPAIESCQTFQKGIAVHVQGMPFIGGLPTGVDAAAGKAWGHLSAIDVASGEIRWQYRDPLPMMGGALSTAGGLVFTGTLSGEALALDARSGEVVWRQRIGGGIRSQPIAWELDGRAYVAIGAGSWATIDAYISGVDSMPEGGHLFVFALPESPKR